MGNGGGDKGLGDGNEVESGLSALDRSDGKADMGRSANLGLATVLSVLAPAEHKQMYQLGLSRSSWAVSRAE